jgi:hypothetical protein
MKKPTKGKKTLPKIEIGSYHAGGIVFHIDETGEHGLVMAPISGLNSGSVTFEFYESDLVQWGAMGVDIATTDEGRSNTDLILAATPGIKTAASVCRDLTLNGFSDWYLPSAYELSCLYEVIEEFDWDEAPWEWDRFFDYWTSSQDYAHHACTCRFDQREEFQIDHKDTKYFVLPIREF